MRRYDGFGGLTPESFQSPVGLTIGVFDGVHRGHAALLRELVSWSESGEAVVITFDRHPRAVLSGASPPLLTSVAHRLLLFERLGIAATIVLPFDTIRAATEPEDFLSEIARHVRPARLLFGANHRFGKGRRGDQALASTLGPRLGFEVRALALEHDDGAISSTRIREAIREGRLTDAEALLGHPVSVFGEVCHGEARGRLLGFPTANILLDAVSYPPRGVYAAEVRIAGRELSPRLAIVNIGQRPTFRESTPQDILEAHLLDFSGDLYGAAIEVCFLSAIRPEQRFSGPAPLKAQIEADRALAIERHGSLNKHGKPG